ncbi:MAG: FliM/FliN family flagellar motor switch protein [Puniceicoccales bacterium]|jgi:flagellar motor switch/type III secretory pathway protein FliN|nr:FliM/FliN family flagellar motor switch protein [Puniceicoccales bacterium]
MDEQNQIEETEEDDIEYIDTTTIDDLVNEAFQANPEENPAPETPLPPSEQSVKLDEAVDDEPQTSASAPIISNLPELSEKKKHKSANTMENQNQPKNPPSDATQVPSPEDPGQSQTSEAEHGANSNPPSDATQVPSPEDSGQSQTSEAIQSIPGQNPSASSLEEIEQNIEKIKSQNDTSLTEIMPETVAKPDHAVAPSIDDENRQTKHVNPSDTELSTLEEVQEYHGKKPKHQVTLTFEIFDQKIPISELETIDKGYVFSCDNPAESPVTICANGTPIGSGELVNVSGKTGVRILEIFDK